MVQSRLGRAVSIVVDDGDPDAVDTADVDDPRGVTVGAGGGEEGQAELAEGEGALEVEGEDLGPRRVRVLVDAGAPGGAGVVDQDVQALGFEGFDAGDEVLAGLELLEVGGDRDGDGGAGAGGDRGELGDGLVEGLGVAAGEVDFCAVGDEAFRDHPADALGSCDGLR